MTQEEVMHEADVKSAGKPIDRWIARYDGQADSQKWWKSVNDSPMAEEGSPLCTKHMEM